MYVDDFILISKEQSAITAFVQSLHNGPKNFVFTEEGALNPTYLGVCITKLSGSEGFKMSQPFLIDGIIKTIGFELATTKGARDNARTTYPLLNRDVNGPAKKAKSKYRGLVGMLGYLQGTTFLDISMATHQCARFGNDPKISH